MHLRCRPNGKMAFRTQIVGFSAGQFLFPNGSCVVNMIAVLEVLRRFRGPGYELLMAFFAVLSRRCRSRFVRVAGKARLVICPRDRGVLLEGVTIEAGRLSARARLQMSFVKEKGLEFVRPRRKREELRVLRALGRSPVADSAKRRKVVDRFIRIVVAGSTGGVVRNALHFEGRSDQDVTGGTGNRRMFAFLMREHGRNLVFRVYDCRRK